MRLKTFCFILTATAAVVLFQAGSTALSGAALTSVALTGQVTSAEEAQMDGVLGTAKKTGSTIATSVASDQTGHYSFPRNRLEPGQYSIRIRAIGYEIDDPGPIDISQEKTATADLKLHKAADLSKQLTNSEWMASIPVPEDQKNSLLNCEIGRASCRERV